MAREGLLGMVAFVALALCGCQQEQGQTSFYLNTASQTPVLVFGDSLSAGYGVSEEKAWPSLLEARLREEGLIRQDQQVANYSRSGETSEGGLARFEEALSDSQPHTVVLELGSNDALRRQSMAHMKDNLEQMISRAQQQNVQVVLVVTDLPHKFFFINTDGFTSIYQELAQEHPKIILVPNLLDGVNSKSSLMQDDGMHPNELGQPRMLLNMWDAVLEASEKP